MKSTFQVTLTIVSLVVFAIAIAAFSGIFSSSTTTADKTAGPSGIVTVWGTMPYEGMQKYISDFNVASNGYTLAYEERSVDTFYDEFITALANNEQPDVVIFPSELLAQLRPKLYTIPFTAYNQRSFLDTNVDGAQLYVDSDGISALPLFVDPLVVYYNKDILASRNFIAPPLSWKVLQELTPSFVRRDPKTNTIATAAIGLGNFDNVNHARDILSALFLQTGNPIVSRDVATGVSTVQLAQGRAVSAIEEIPTAQALNFYTSFSNPVNKNYSWNTSLDSSRQLFLAGKVGFYIGRASELFLIQSQNPNLNFDVVQLFQPENAVRPITYGSFIAAGVVKNAPNFTAAYAAASALAEKDSIDSLTKQFSLPPTRRDLLLRTPNNPYMAVFFKAAIASFSWSDPNKARTDTIFRDLVGTVNSGSSDATTALGNAARDLQSTSKR